MSNELDNIKKTALYETHVKHAARMVNFAGWYMPVQYESIIKEHEAVRSHSGIFDISHMGEFFLEGKDVIKFLQYIMINDLNLLEPSKGQYSCMCYENGAVVDDLVYYEETPERFRMIVNASNIEKDFKWLNDHIGESDVKITNLSTKRSRIAFQGPKTDENLQPLVDVDLSQINRFYFAHCTLKGNSIFIARTGYTGERGFEISFENEFAEKIWNDLLNTGAIPAGLGARDSLRLEASYSLYGHEISDAITPIEAGLSWLVKPKEGIEYIGKNVLMNQKSEGAKRIIVGLNLIDKGIIRENFKIFKNGNEIGFVTSGGYSPTLKKTIGLGLVEKQYSEIGNKIEIEIRNKLLKGEIVSTPFYRNV
ncbi:MAG: glycine cleavage system aminomethyltransferase GcvT [Candidatus Lokiarchaeota archaeon]|nr:glycine cleavage system aminomethyltransferase GcvT [Candidatus Lokiarchaeota archaeon]